MKSSEIDSHSKHSEPFLNAFFYNCNEDSILTEEEINFDLPEIEKKRSFPSVNKLDSNSFGETKYSRILTKKGKLITTCCCTLNDYKNCPHCKKKNKNKSPIQEFDVCDGDFKILVDQIPEKIIEPNQLLWDYNSISNIFPPFIEVIFFSLFFLITLMIF